MSDIAPLLALLARQRFRIDNEKLLQAQMATVLEASGVTFSAEHVLSPGNRIDFLIGDVGIEAKIKGQRRAILRQCERYASHDAIGALIVITNAAMGLPPEINGKPIHVFNLGKAWLG